MKKLFADLDNDIRIALFEQLRNLWTHTSTAIEGNTLTLGDTAFLLNEGLTISGKPLKDHEEVVGHAKAIEIIYSLLEKDKITKNDLFLLHKAVQTEKTMDIYSPVGAWKVENNGTYIVKDSKQIFINYVSPEKVDKLMTQWLKLLNSQNNSMSESEALQAYSELHISFVKIHPFADGNGRMARLVANIPVLRAGLAPILISNTRRRKYIEILSEYHLNSPEPTESNLTPGDIEKFKNFLKSEWKNSLELIKDAYKEQEKRDEI